MNCKFEKVNNKLICSMCGYSIEKDIDPKSLHKTCRPVKTKEEVQEISKQYPSLFQMAKNAVTAAVEYAKDGFTNVDDIEEARRMEICTGNEGKGIPKCQFYDSSQGRCTECGCFAALKTKIRSGGCPKGKW